MVIISIALAAKACASLPEGWRSDPGSQDFIYYPLNVRFPVNIGDFVRVNPTTYDSEGLDVSIGYYHTKVPLVLTLYIYPRSYYEHTDLERHFQYCIKEIKRVTPNCVVISEKSTNFPLGAAEVKGLKAFVHCKVDGTERGSYAVLLPYGERFVLLRVSFYGGDNENAMKSAWIIMNNFLKAVKLPRQ